jgi:hypothetical protein
MMWLWKVPATFAQRRGAHSTYMDTARFAKLILM